MKRLSLPVLDRKVIPKNCIFTLAQGRQAFLMVQNYHIQMIAERHLLQDLDLLGISRSYQDQCRLEALFSPLLLGNRWPRELNNVKGLCMASTSSFMLSLFSLAAWVKAFNVF